MRHPPIAAEQRFLYNLLRKLQAKQSPHSPGGELGRKRCRPTRKLEPSPHSIPKADMSHLHGAAEQRFLSNLLRKLQEKPVLPSPQAASL